MGAQEALLDVRAVEGDHVGVRRRRDTRFLGDGLCDEHQQAERGEDGTVSGFRPSSRRVGFLHGIDLGRPDQSPVLQNR